MRPPAALLLCLLLPLAARADGLPLSRTAPGHADPPKVIPRIPWPPAEAHMTVPQETITLVLKDTPWRDLGKPDPVLSSACKLGRFAPTRSLFRVLLGGKTGQAMLEAVPKYRHDLLFDPDRHARAGEAYYFRNPGWADCEVHYDGPQAPRTLGERGTALPTVDREMLRQKALEKWGKKQR